jgi:hypothetical protein
MAKKTSKKKKGKKRGAPKVTHVYYECQGNACVESITQPHVGNTDSVVVLSAIGTAVTLDFSPFVGSPFKGKKKTITISADKSKHMKVDRNIASQAYQYDLSCDACTGARPPLPPQFIVP